MPRDTDSRRADQRAGGRTAGRALSYREARHRAPAHEEGARTEFDEFDERYAPDARDDEPERGRWGDAEPAYAYGDEDERREWDDRDEWDDEEDDSYADDGYDADRSADMRDNLDEPRANDAWARELQCPVARRCGGCEWLSMPYDMQLQRKQDYIEELFADIPCEVGPIVAMREPWGYRNKVQLPFAPSRESRQERPTPRWGIFERGSHHIVPCTECLVEDPIARPIIATVADLMTRYGVPAYDEKTGEGLIRYALVRVARKSGDAILTLVCNGDRIPHERDFVEDILDRHQEVMSVVLNENRERTSVILGKQEYVLAGPGYIEDELCGCTFRISSTSFYQTNPAAAEDLYSLAVEMAGLRPGDRIGDAYCGTGTIGIVAAKASGARLLGVERNPDAVEDARVNAQLNGIEDAEFVAADAGTMFAHMARQGEKLDVVFMDPPRAGSSQAFLANLSRLGPRRVVYISCEPRTQRHDIAALVRNGYRVKRIRPVDMFPHTDHVENVVMLERPPRSGHSYAKAKQAKRAKTAARAGM